MKRLVSVLVAGTALSISASSARAQDIVHTEDTAHPSESTPAFAASRAGMTASVWPGKDNFAMVLGSELQLQLAHQVFLDLAYAGSFASVHDATFDSGDYMGFGNPTIGLHVAAAAAPNLHFFLGGGVTVPLLQDPNNQISNAAFFASRIEGYYNLDRFVRGHMAVRVAGGMEWHMAGPMFFRAEIRPVVMIPTNDMYPVLQSTSAGLGSRPRGTSSLFLEHAVEIEARSSMGLGIGARIQGVTMPMEDDLQQETAEPFLALTPQRKGFYARVGMPVGLDPDLGFGFERNKLVAAKITIGGQW